MRLPLHIIKTIRQKPYFFKCFAAAACVVLAESVRKEDILSVRCFFATEKRLKTLYRKNIFHIAPIKQTDRMIIREMRSETVLFLQCKSTFSQKLHSILPKAGCICRKSWNIWIGKGIEFMRGSLHSYRKSK